MNYFRVKAFEIEFVLSINGCCRLLNISNSVNKMLIHSSLVCLSI